MLKENQDVIIIRAIAEELNICRHYLNEFNILFPDEESHYELYNSTAPNFFSYVSKLFFDFFLLKISKMLDPAVLGKFENLSLYQLVMVIKKDSTSHMQFDIQKEIDEIKLKAELILNARNKIISHTDLNLRINKSVIGQVNIKSIEAIMLDMRNLVNRVLKSLDEPEYSFIWARDKFGADALVNSMKLSREYLNIIREPKIAKIINQMKLKDI